MASGIMVGLPRPTASNGVPKMNLPVIQHPSSRMGDKSRLGIRGESRQGPGSISRTKTFVSLDEGRLHLGLDRENFPPLRKDVDKPKEESLVGRSQPNEEGFEYYQLYGHTGVYSPRNSTDIRQSIFNYFFPQTKSMSIDTTYQPFGALTLMYSLNVFFNFYPKRPIQEQEKHRYNNKVRNRGGTFLRFGCIETKKKDFDP